MGGSGAAAGRRATRAPHAGGSPSEVFLTREPDLRRAPAEYRARVYGADPLYPLGIEAQTGVEAFEIERRIGLPALFSDPESLPDDFLNCATIALDVRAHDEDSTGGGSAQ